MFWPQHRIIKTKLKSEIIKIRQLRNLGNKTNQIEQQFSTEELKNKSEDNSTGNETTIRNLITGNKFEKRIKYRRPDN